MYQLFYPSSYKNFNEHLLNIFIYKAGDISDNSQGYQAQDLYLIHANASEIHEVISHQELNLLKNIKKKYTSARTTSKSAKVYYSRYNK